ncbi:hypothetical protein GCM10023187_15520 [Nibrella viscosa]|uniref:DUF3575 domain-containing protein n=2 Tax=Nibrella viscosa TaxID=1084524 RepID=A0ABP8K891_9BACT
MHTLAFDFSPDDLSLKFYSLTIHMMKKLMRSALLAAGVLGSLYTAHAQSQTVIKANIFSPLVRTGNFAIERALNENHSFQVGFYFTGFKADGTRFNGIGVTPEYRFYLSDSKDAPAGFYVAPFLRYQNFKLTSVGSGGGGTLSTFGGGVTAGYQVLLKDRIAFDFFLGPSYNAGTAKANDGSTESFSTNLFSGFGLRTGITFGIAF